MNKEELEKRMLEFSKNLVKTLKKLPRNLINNKLIGQVVSSGTSIGANYVEGNAAESFRDFQHKYKYCFQRSQRNKVLVGYSDISKSRLRKQSPTTQTRV